MAAAVPDTTTATTTFVARSEGSVSLDAASETAVAGFLRHAAVLHRAVLTLRVHKGDGDDCDANDIAVVSSAQGNGGDGAEADEPQRYARLLLTGPASAVSTFQDIVHSLSTTANLHAPPPPPHRLTSVVLACLKIAQDLVIQLQRLQQHLESSAIASRTVARETCCQIWTSRHVEALGARLRELDQRFQDLGGVSNKHHVKAGNETHQWICASKTATQEIKNPKDVAAYHSSEISASSDNSNHSSAPNGVKDGSSKDMCGLNAEIVKIPSRPRYAPDGILHEFILDSLAYKSMHYREQEVVKAHNTTFEWVFTSYDKQPQQQLQQHGTPDHQFSTWLATDELGPIYWITGKPGSGKSTFMGFLYDHESTADHLEVWANGLPVCKAGFFFWTSGSREQRSQSGLLRSLLHQLLSSNPELTSQAFPSLWQKLRTMTTKERINLVLDWSTPELIQAFQAFVDAAVPRIKICLFVDGLDEFEGDHILIIDFFKNLSLVDRGRSIKMCLSSRAWAVFENAFQHTVPHLRLQDLTYADMYRYTRDRLRTNVHIRRLVKQDVSSGEELITRTVQRADGVFLWTRLALDQILEKFQSGESLANLLQTVHALPTELDDLFVKLLFENQNHAQLVETAVLFQLMKVRESVADFVGDDSASSLTVWELAFALNREDDELAINGVVVEADDICIQERCEATVNQIRQRFAGLLDLHSPHVQGNLRRPRFISTDAAAEAVGAARQQVCQRITYIHRTVRDWLMEATGISERLITYSPTDFDPNLRLLRSYVLRLKRPLGEIEHHRRLDEWWPDIALAMTHARYVVCDPSGLQRRFLNQLNDTLSWYWLRKPQDPHDHWARSAFGSYEARMKAPPIWQPFLCLAVKFGLASYVEGEIEAAGRGASKGNDEQEELQNLDATPLLSYATEFLCSRKKTIFPLSDPRLVESLLRSPNLPINPGPNHEYLDFWTRAPTTPWLMLLRHLRDARRRDWIEFYDVDLEEGTGRWAGIVRLFMEVDGADVDAVVVADPWDPEITAHGVLELLDQTYGAVEVRELLVLMHSLRIS